MTTRLLPHRTTHNQSSFRWSFVNQNLGDQIGQSEERKIPLTANENSKENRLNCLKCGKTRVIWFTFASDWSREWHEFSGPITEQSTVERVAQVFWNNHRAKYSRESGASFLDQSQSKVQSREWREFSGPITEQSTVERVAQVFWNNHRAKYSKNKAIPSYLQYSIENCYFSTSYLLEKCNFAFETKLTNIFIIMCWHRHLVKEGFTQLTGFTKINSSLARRTRNLSKQKISKKRLKTAHDPSGSPWWTHPPFSLAK